jgi:hypothetical protein
MSHKGPPISIAIGNPRKAMELIQPKSVSLNAKSLPSWVRIPARIEKLIAVTIKARQEPRNKRLPEMEFAEDIL